ncbi:MAG: hypothetical protein K6T34_07660 [Thermoflavifilum sp.]|nr:hypothetical protein [Thermoflavifilum sp.]
MERATAYTGKNVYTKASIVSGTLAQKFMVLISFFWFGFFSAISFMEAPVKFQAPHLSLSVGVEIGRIVFHVSQEIQWVMLILLTLVTWLWISQFKHIRIWVIGLWLIMLIESFLLLPALDKQAQQVIAGHILPMTAIHWVFVLTELLKIPVLLVIGWTTMKKIFFPIS